MCRSDSFRVTPAEPSKKTFDATKEEVQKLTEMALASRGTGGDQWVFTCSEDVVRGWSSEQLNAAHGFPCWYLTCCPRWLWTLRIVCMTQIKEAMAGLGQKPAEAPAAAEAEEDSSDGEFVRGSGASLSRATA